MHEIQHRCEEHEGEFDGLGDAGEKRGQRHRKKQTLTALRRSGLAA
jgi:hypothetical protein